ncbi:tetratricopeptide repeat protein [Polyangium jinanense]|uniref:tetratricopeptide repeat protein n=1 Tax=Polyangium jinanense TaxID=2829994 RepID=UPI00234231C6|nr:tetratricopeptide repeat protein [Polyangium jinanense]MDC3959510.1 tetratricopeptide repeat protein [Polyangium jinanense]
MSALVKLADTARKQGRWEDAELGYREALKLRNDATVVGRLGLTLVAAGQPARGARNLMEAIERGGGVGAEQEEFFKVFKRIRPTVCLLYVKGNLSDAVVSIDGGPFHKEGGVQFKLFVAPGKHVLEGKSEERGVARAERTCPEGGEATTVLSWHWPDGLPTKPERLFRHRRKGEVIPGLDDARPADIPREEDEPPPRKPIFGGVAGDERPKPKRGSVGGGVAVVSGVATWAPAVGVALHGSVRPIEVLSIDLDARAAWLTSGIAGEPISGMTAGGLLSVCGHWRWLFGCATGYLGLIAVDFDEARYEGRSYVFFTPGLGGRVGARIPIGDAFAIRVAADVVGLNGGIRVAVDQETVADHPPVMIGGSVMGTWEF